MNNHPAIKRDKPNKKTLKMTKSSRNIAWDILIGILTFALIYAILITAVSPEKHEVRVGDIPSEPIPAPRDVEDKLATQARVELAKLGVEDVYSINNNVSTSTITALYDVYNQMDDARQEAMDRIENWQAEQQNEQHQQADDPDYPDNGVEGTDPLEQGQEELQLEPDLEDLYDEDFIQDLKGLFSTDLSESSIMTVLTSEEEDLGELKAILESSIRGMLNEGLRPDELEKGKLNLTGDMQNATLPDELGLLGTNIGHNLLKPNLLFDAGLTNIEKQKVVENTEKVVYIKGQYIVNAGQPVTEAQMEMLAELGLLKDKLDFSLIVGIFISIFICLGIIVLYLIY
ncbi:MAG TPA: hypothetical protein VFD33_06140, partial [Bacillota bacterium]|nr:hypothetical protein [Bacillota bacterium]